MLVVTICAWYCLDLFSLGLLNLVFVGYAVIKRAGTACTQPCLYCLTNYCLAFAVQLS